LQISFVNSDKIRLSVSITGRLPPQPEAVNEDVPRYIPGSDHGLATPTGLAGFASSSSFSIGKRVGL